MKKNVAGQRVGAQMVSASDGSAFTGAVTVSVTLDAGTQATGSVGSGACTHEGNGYHTYAPAQAETNGDLVAFTFTGTGAIPVTVQIYTTFPQTGDSFARLGAPAGASVSADIAAIEAQTDDIGVAGAGLTAIPWNAAWDAEVQSEAADALTAYDPPTKAELDAAVAPLATSSALDAVDNFVDTEVTAIKAVTDALGTTAAARLQTAVLTEVTGTVDTTGFTPTTTEFEADDITEATADHFNGRVVIFTSGALQYQATSITDYSLIGGRGHFTVVALTEAPANNGTFIIV